MAGDSIDVRLRAVEFVLAHLLSTTRSGDDLRADREDLQALVERGDARGVLIDFKPEEARDVIYAAIELLEEAEFQQEHGKR